MKTPVYLRVYDISGGAARTWSPIVLGRRVEGVWHSGVEVFGYEYFYGGGVVKMRPENVEKTFGISPTKRHHLGYTTTSRVQFETHLQSIRGMFRKDVYDLVNWNCNHFSDHCSRRLTGRGIPEYIVELPNEIGKTFMGKILLNFIKMLQGGAAPIGVDDPEHPSRRLEDGRPRRNSCPASPTSNRAAAADESIYVAASTIHATIKPTGRPLRHTHRHRTAHNLSSKTDMLKQTTMDPMFKVTERGVAELRLTDQMVRSDGRDQRRPDPSLRVIPGDPIGGYPTEIVLSPKHKRLYEAERDRFCSPVLQ